MARPYVNQLLRKPAKYFPMETVKTYKEQIFSKLKSQSHSNIEELDFIY